MFKQVELVDLECLEFRGDNSVNSAEFRFLVQISVYHQGRKMSSLVAYASSEDSDSEDGEVEERNDLSLSNKTKEKPPEKVAITEPVLRNESEMSTSNNRSTNEKTTNVGDHSDQKSEESNMFQGFYFTFITFITFSNPELSDINFWCFILICIFLV